MRHVYPQSLRDSPCGACLRSHAFASGVIAASMFFEHLADASAAAQMRLYTDRYKNETNILLWDCLLRTIGR